MYDKDFSELVKIAAEKLKEDTVYKMLTRSEDYQKESDERDKAERNYEQLGHFPRQVGYGADTESLICLCRRAEPECRQEFYQELFCGLP